MGLTPASLEIHLALKDHRFMPAPIYDTGKSALKNKLANENANGDNFENKDLHLDKEVQGMSHALVFVGP